MADSLELPKGTASSVMGGVAKAKGASKSQGIPQSTEICAVPNVGGWKCGSQVAWNEAF